MNEPFKGLIEAESILDILIRPFEAKKNGSKIRTQELSQGSRQQEANKENDNNKTA